MKIFKFNEVESTQKIAKNILKENLSEEFIVIAEKQTNGYGRHGRKWHSPKGGIYATIVLKAFKGNLNLISQAAALAVRKAINRICQINAKVKWPNDIIVNNRKIGGIISEAIIVGNKPKHLIIGIGVNVNIGREQLPPELREKATSTLIEAGRNFNIEEILNEIIRNLVEYKKLLEKNRDSKILKEWRRHDIILGRKVRIINKKEIVGYANDINCNGALILKCLDGKEIEIYAEEVKIKIE